MSGLTETIQLAIREADAMPRTYEVIADHVASRVRDHLTRTLAAPESAEIFRAAWHAADEDGAEGERVARGLAAVALEAIS